jgi:hypothetical protein
VLTYFADAPMCPSSATPRADLPAGVHVPWSARERRGDRCADPLPQDGPCPWSKWLRSRRSNGRPWSRSCASCSIDGPDAKAAGAGADLGSGGGVADLGGQAVVDAA